MDTLMLLRRAQEAGLRVEPVGDKLVVRGPKHAKATVKLLAEHKIEVLAALAMPGVVTSLYEGEPGPEMPCFARRGLVEDRSDSQFLHYCAVCGRWGGFGCGVNLRAGRLGRWYCREHRPRGPSVLPSSLG